MKKYKHKKIVKPVVARLWWPLTISMYMTLLKLHSHFIFKHGLSSETWSSKQDRRLSNFIPLLSFLLNFDMQNRSTKSLDIFKSFYDSTSTFVVPFVPSHSFNFTWKLFKLEAHHTPSSRLSLGFSFLSFFFIYLFFWTNFVSWFLMSV